MHTRHKDIGRFQHSCTNDPDKPNSRWCGNCYECARVYLFLTALGISPSRVGFTTNMLTAGKRKLFYLFDDTKAARSNSLFQSYPERILAFFICHKMGVDEDLVRLFARRYSSQYENRKNEFFRRYIRVHEPVTIPQPLWQRLKPLYEKEVAGLRKRISAWL